MSLGWGHAPSTTFVPRRVGPRPPWKWGDNFTDVVLGSGYSHENTWALPVSCGGLGVKTLVSLDVKPRCQWRWDYGECRHYLGVPVDSCNCDGVDGKQGGGVSNDCYIWRIDPNTAWLWGCTDILIIDTCIVILDSVVSCMDLGGVVLSQIRIWLVLSDGGAASLRCSTCLLKFGEARLLARWSGATGSTAPVPNQSNLDINPPAQGLTDSMPLKIFTFDPQHQQQVE